MFNNVIEQGEFHGFPRIARFSKGAMGNVIRKFKAYGPDQTSAAKPINKSRENKRRKRRKK